MAQRKRKNQEEDFPRQKKNRSQKDRQRSALNKETSSPTKAKKKRPKASQSSASNRDRQTADSSKVKKRPIKQNKGSSNPQKNGKSEKKSHKPMSSASKNKEHAKKAKESLKKKRTAERKPLKELKAGSAVKITKKHREVMEREQKKEFRLQVILTGLVLILCAVILFGLILFGLSVGKGIVNGDSMQPTLEDKEKVIYLRHESVDAFDIIAFHPPNHPDQQYVKRVIGVPGDNVSYEEGILTINNQEINEEYIVYDGGSGDDFELQDIIDNTEGLSGSLREVSEIPQDMYLVLGDNRGNSEDSRTFGLIKANSVIGVVRFRYSPFSKLGAIY